MLLLTKCSTRRCTPCMKWRRTRDLNNFTGDHPVYEIKYHMRAPLYTNTHVAIKQMKHQQHQAHQTTFTVNSGQRMIAVNTIQVKARAVENSMPEVRSAPAHWLKYCDITPNGLLCWGVVHEVYCIIMFNK